jgi:hypothetical protein
MILTDTVFATGVDQPTNFYGTSLTSGTLGLRYAGASVDVGYYSGGTWNVLDSFAFSGSNVTFNLSGEVQGTTGASLAGAIQEVRFSAVPVPGALYLLAPGLAGLALVRRRFRK